MSDRKSAILAAAQGELLRATVLRRTRRRAALSAALLVIVASVAVAVVVSRGSATSSGGGSSPSPNGAELASAAPGASGDSPEARSTPVVPTPPDAPRSSIEIVATATPTPGFVEVIDDRGLEEALHGLAKPTGIAIVGGRSRLVANAEPNAGGASH